VPPLKKFAKYVFILFLIAFIGSVVIVFIFRWAPVPFTSVMAQRQIQAIFSEEPYVEYKWYSWDEINPYMGMSVIAAEDQNFANHRGFDFEAIQKAMDEARDGGRSRGASTLSQQVAKNLFLWNGRSWFRKGLEVYFTVLIELFWPKQRILEVYVNIAEMGPNVFGVGAASIKYFNVEPSEISRRQAALLAASLPNPRTHRVRNPSNYMRSRQSWILRQVNGLGGLQYLEQF
jgi:monofunctional biosynthetic peptidoglycan transglycosylase